MDINYVKDLCKSVGLVKDFKKNTAVFGNMELEIETPRHTTLRVVSDRGIFSCFVIKKGFLNRILADETKVNLSENVTFHTLEATIEYLKENLPAIEGC